MQAQGGGGVGVFAEYKAGGHWHVYWTCDTNVNPQGALSCAFDVRATLASGAPSNVAAEGGLASSAVTSSSNALEAATTTTTDVPGFSFDAPAGSSITLEATVEGSHDGRYFFFVQDGVVNGGVDSCKLTDPMMFEPTRP
jgi:hypothetical protein